MTVGATVALTRWRDPVAAAVLRAKLEGRREVFAALGARIGALVVRPSPVELVVPVPTDPRRARRRGADHTRVLARAVGRSLGVPAGTPLRTGRRVADRGAAVTAHRSALPPDAFAPRRGGVALVRDRWVLLVDDVLTTGATVAAAAAMLTAMGARRVDVAVAARAGRHPLGGTPDGARAPVAPARAQK